jgi:hypothetical protein
MHNKRLDNFHTSIPPAIAFVWVLMLMPWSDVEPPDTFHIAPTCHTQAAPEFKLEVFLCVCTLLALSVRRDSRRRRSIWGNAMKLEREARMQAKACMRECKQERWNEVKENTLEARRTYGTSMSIVSLLQLSSLYVVFSQKWIANWRKTPFICAYSATYNHMIKTEPKEYEKLW